MKKSLSIFILLYSFTVHAQEAREIIVKSRNACLSVNDASFNATMQFKFFSESDTLRMQGRINVKKADTINYSNVLGRMYKSVSGSTYEFLLFPDKKIYISSSGKVEIDTINESYGFEGNIHSSMLNIGFLKQKPFSALDQKGTKYTLVKEDADYYSVLVEVQPDKEYDIMNHKYFIRKKDFIPVYVESIVHDKKQNNYQYNTLKIENLSLNDDSANWYLNQYSSRKFDTIEYLKPYVAPVLLDSGTVAPNWKLPSTNGDSISLDQFKGKYVLIDFWYVACHPCQMAVPSLIKLQNKYKDKLVVIGLNPFDKKEKVVSFMKQNKINYSIALGNRNLSFDLYHVNAFPTLYLINREGKIIHHEVGFGEDKEYPELFISGIAEMLK